MAAIEAAKLSIEMFNRVDGAHSKPAALILNAQAWELFSKAVLIKKRENIYLRDGTSITGEKCLNKMVYVYKVIGQKEGETIGQIISLRNEATHDVLPPIPEEIEMHLMYLSLRFFHSTLRVQFPTYFKLFDRNFLSVSFRELTFYSEKVSRLLRNARKYNRKENKLLYLLDRGCGFMGGTQRNRMVSYDEWQQRLRALPRKARPSRHLAIYRYINKQDDVRIIPVEVPRGHRPSVRIEKTKDPLAPVMVEKSDLETDWPYFTKDFAKKIGRSQNYTSRLLKDIGVRADKTMCVSVRMNPSGSSVPKYNDRALGWVKVFLDKQPAYNPYHSRMKP